VAETLNFRRASEKVFLSQPALSRSVANFEQHIGLRIFERTNTSVTITHAGHQIIRLARNIVSEANSIEDEVRGLSTGTSGQVRFGLGPFLGNYIISSVVKEFHRNNPDVRMLLNISNWATLQQQLEEEEIEFFIADIKEIKNDANLSLELLSSPRIGFYCDKNHTLYQTYEDRVVPSAQLLQHKIISVSIPANVKEEIKQALGISKGKFSVHIECDDIMMLKSMLPDTDLVRLCADDAMRTTRHTNIRRLNTRLNPDLLGIWGLVTLGNKQLSPASSRLAGKLRERLMDKKSLGL